MLQRLRAAKAEQRGFTLIELLIVIVILGVLAAVVVFAVNGIQDRGTASACKSDVQTVSVAAESYYAQEGRYADSMKQLVEYGLLRSVPSDDNYTVDYDADNKSQPKSVAVSSTYCPASDGTGNSSTGPPSSSLPTRTVVYRVNAGGPRLAALDDGPDWAADQSSANPLRIGAGGAGTGQFDSGIETLPSVPSTTPNAVFDTERFDAGESPDMQWAFPVNTSDTYTVRLYFANRCGCTSYVGARVFNVRLDGTQVLGSYDIFADAGYKGTMQQWEGITEPDGTINVDFGPITQSPLINGFEIIQFSS